MAILKLLSVFVQIVIEFMYSKNCFIKTVTIAVISILTLVAEARTQTISYVDTFDRNFIRATPNYSQFEVYITKDGKELRVGSILESGLPTGVITTKTMTFEIVTDREFLYFYEGKRTLVDGRLDGYKRMKPINFWLGQKSESLVVLGLIAEKTGGIRSKSVRMVVIALVEGSDQYRTITDYETALEVGEIINPDRLVNQDGK